MKSTSEMSKKNELTSKFETLLYEVRIHTGRWFACQPAQEEELQAKMDTAVLAIRAFWDQEIIPYLK